MSLPSPDAPPDSPLLQRTRALADGFAALLFPHVEVVVHDLSTQTVAYIANNVSRRAIGDDSALEANEIEIDLTGGVFGPYEKRNWDGAVIRSVSVVVNAPDGAAIGLVCINLHTQAFAQARAVLDALVCGIRVQPQPAVLFQDDWQERINTFVHGWLQAHQASLATLTHAQKRTLVEELHREGAFKGRSAPDYVARVLGMGRATVFKHVKGLKELKRLSGRQA